MVSGKIGFLFPGQGAQYVGMGKEWASQFKKAKNIYEEADSILGYSLSEICFEGPEDKLTQTQFAQPAIFVTSLALFEVLQEHYPELKPHFVAGLSLGEFSALVAAGSLRFGEGLSLVRERAELMERAARKNQGAMISVLGLTQNECEAVARESQTELANLNAPDQFVLSGKVSAIRNAAELAEGMGARKVIPLKVSGAFHSALMEEAQKGLQASLKKVSIKSPGCVFVPNATARPESDPGQIRILLEKQVTHSVRWIETIREAFREKIVRFIEFGPGRVLKGLVKRIEPSLEVHSFEKVSDLEGVANYATK